MAEPTWRWWKQDQIGTGDPLLGPIVGKVWVGRLVVELCFRDMGRRGFRWGPWFMQDKKLTQKYTYFPQVQVFFVSSKDHFYIFRKTFAGCSEWSQKPKAENSKKDLV